MTTPKQADCYYCIGFHYLENDRLVRLGKANASLRYSEAYPNSILNDAIEYLISMARKKNVDIRHAYAWPDGSLYQYVRTSQPTTESQFRALLNCKYVRVAQVTLKEPDMMNSNLITLAELFLLDRESRHQRYLIRQAERDAFWAGYHRSRETCDKCKVRPEDAGCGRLACRDCDVLFREAMENERIWKEVPKSFVA